MSETKKQYLYKNLEKATKAELQAWISEVLAYLRPLAPNYDVSPEIIEAFCNDWTGKSADAVAITNDYFDEFWRLYPRRVGSKAKARQAFNAAIIRGFTSEQILNGTAMYARIRNEITRKDPSKECYTAHPTTFLNQDRFLAVESMRKELMGLLGNTTMTLATVEGF